MNKKTHKNNIPIVWPQTTYFTIKDLVPLNPQIPVEITLRSKVKKAIEEDGTVAEVGSIPGGKGRPKKVFALTPITDIILNKVEAAGYSLVDRARERYINVASISGVIDQSSNIKLHIDSSKPISA